MTGVVVLGIVLVLAGAFGLYRKRTDGRFKSVSTGSSGSGPDSGSSSGSSSGETALTADQLGGQLGERATLVEFSSAFCAPCRATRQILDRVTSDVEGVALIEVDAEKNLELVRELNIMRTPTVLILDARGAIAHRASGQPTYPAVIAALSTAIPA